jgi:hypothetical protein
MLYEVMNNLKIVRFRHFRNCVQTISLQYCARVLMNYVFQISRAYLQCFISFRHQPESFTTVQIDILH